MSQQQTTETTYVLPKSENSHDYGQLETIKYNVNEAAIEVLAEKVNADRSKRNATMYNKDGRKNAAVNAEATQWSPLQNLSVNGEKLETVLTKLEDDATRAIPKGLDNSQLGINALTIKTAKNKYLAKVQELLTPTQYKEILEVYKNDPTNRGNKAPPYQAITDFVSSVLPNANLTNFVLDIQQARTKYWQDFASKRKDVIAGALKDIAAGDNGIKNLMAVDPSLVTAEKTNVDIYQKAVAPLNLADLGVLNKRLVLLTHMPSQGAAILHNGSLNADAKLELIRNEISKMIKAHLASKDLSADDKISFVNKLINKTELSKVTSADLNKRVGAPVEFAANGGHLVKLQVGGRIVEITGLAQTPTIAANQSEPQPAVKAAVFSNRNG